MGAIFTKFPRGKQRSGKIFCPRFLFRLNYRIEVKDHKVKWGTKFDFTCRMSANPSNGILDSAILRLSVRKVVKPFAYTDFFLALLSITLITDILSTKIIAFS